MESDSQPASYFQFFRKKLLGQAKGGGERSPTPRARERKKSPINVANILGGAIAFVTLVLPLLAIARYSPSQVNLWQPSNYTLPR